MNIISLLVLISFILFLILSYFLSKRTKNLDDFFVAGRNANTLFLTGTVFASMLSTNGFMGDCAWVYDGHFISLMVINTMCACGYILGSLFFGRYLRASKVKTLPEFFYLVFQEHKLAKYLRMCSAFVVCFSMFAYLISVMQGVGILLESLTDFSKTTSLIAGFIIILAFVSLSGSNGAIISDTLMCIIFLSVTVIAAFYIFNTIENPFIAMKQLAITRPETLKAPNELSYVLTMGIIWCITIAISPWQAGRNLMAKNEHVIFRTSVLSAILTVYFLGILYLLVIVIKYSGIVIDTSEKVVIISALEQMPPILGAMLITGIVQAGISSAMTFLAVIGFSFSEDIIGQISKKEKTDKQKLILCRIIILSVCILCFIINTFELASIRIIAWFASTIIAASWIVSVIGILYIKNYGIKSALASQISGFLTYVIIRFLNELNLITYEAFFCSILSSLIFGIMFLEKNSNKNLNFMSIKLEKTEYKKTKLYALLLIFSGFLLSSLLLKYYSSLFN